MDVVSRNVSVADRIVTEEAHMTPAGKSSRGPLLLKDQQKLKLLVGELDHIPSHRLILSTIASTHTCLKLNIKLI